MKALCAVLCCLLFSPVLAALELQPDFSGPQEPPFIAERPLAIINGTLIDATGAAPKQDYGLVIKGERIVQVEPSAKLTIPADAQVIDAGGMIIMPGIINSNQHIQLNPLYPAPTADLPVAELQARWQETFARMPQRAYIYLMQGVTSMRHTSGPGARVLPVKRAIDAGEIPGPRIFLGGALLMSPQHFASYTRKSKTPAEALHWLRNDFAYSVLDDIDKDTDRFLGPEYNYWKLYMSDEVYDGKNDFSDEELRFIIDKAHRHGKIIDVHAGGHNAGLRRMLAFDIDTLEHPFYGQELIAEETIRGYVDKGAIIDTLLTVMVVGAERAADPHRFNETLYISSMEPKEYRILMRYRDKMLYNRKHPDQPGQAIYARNARSNGKQKEQTDIFGLEGPSYNEIQARRLTSRENMRRFITAGARFSLGTDTPSFLNFQQEDPNAGEFRNMVEMGMTPMQAIIAATRNGAEALGMLDELGTIEVGKLADIIVVASDPLQDVNALLRVHTVIKGGVRYK